MKDDIKMLNVPKGRTLMPGTIRNPDGPGGVNVLPPGTKLNEFEIISLIGEGGFGIVYLAYDHSLKRHVALKEYMPSGLASRTKTLCVTAKSNHHANNFAAGLRSFVNEARLLAQFDSPFLVKVYRFWEANGTAYMVMPYYEGVTLKQAAKEGRVVPTEEWIKSILGRLLDAVEMMHQARCFHRDIAPDNILLLKDGSPLLLDFGAARQVIGNLTQCLTVIVKPGFAPIEQYADIPGLKQGAWTDVYALAAVVYYLISGKLPPAVARIVSDEMVPAREAGKGRYSASFLAGLDKALTVRPENRIQSIPELRKALGIPSSKGSAPPPPPPGKPEIEPTARMTAPLPPASRSLPRAPVNHTTLLNEDAFPQKPIIAERRDFGRERKAGTLPALTLSFLLSLGVAGSAAWAYLHFAHMKPAKLATVAAAREKQAPSRPVAPAAGAAATNRTGTMRSAAPPAPPASPTPATPSSALPPAAAPGAPAQAARPVTPPVTETAAETGSASLAQSAEPKTVEPVRAHADAATEAARRAMLPGAAPDTAATSGASGGSEVHSMDYPKGRYAEAMGSRPEARQPKASPAKPAPAARETAQDKPAKPALAAPVLPPSAGDRNPAGSHAAAVSQPPSLESGPAKKPSAADAPLALAPKSAASETARNNAHAPEVRDQPAEPAAAPAKPQHRETASRAEPDQPGNAGKKTIKFADQTMIGDFTVDPATGIVSGKGRIVWNNGNQFEGTLVKGVKEGKGRFLWANGQLYSGDWSKDSPNGKGLLVYANGNRYEGEVKDGVPHGQGTTRFKGGDVYSGSWVNGKSHGHGRYTWANGSYFEGEFRDGKRTENGKIVFADRGASMTADGSK